MIQSTQESYPGKGSTDFKVDAETRTLVLSEIEKILSPDSIITDQNELAVYESDGLSAHKCLPWLVLLPNDSSQVQKIVRICAEHRVPLVARGAGTGLSGGAMPHQDGVLLSLAKFNRIISVDTDNLSAVVQPGVTNLGISNFVQGQGLYYAPDPSSQIACTIGGNVAENAGGVHCLKYGLTVHNILKIRLVTARGGLLTIGSDALDSPGYDLLALMTGSEGMLGIIVEVTVKLLPSPPDVKLIMAAFKSTRQASEAVGEIIARGIIPAGLELMDSMAIQAAEAFVGVGYPTDAEALLLCELDGYSEEVESNLGELMPLLEANGAYELRIAGDEAERLELWKGRKSAFPAVGRLAPDYLCMDGTIPRHNLAEALAAIAALSAEYGLRIANVFHAGDGNLHPLILYDANNPGELEMAEELGAKILEMCIRLGGTITGEHGVGIEKINQMCVQFTELELSHFHGVKQAFDPTGFLNPGKAVPTLRRCAEFGAMHVHVGEEKFPELERF
jgi:glycolate oxidase